MKSGGKPTFLTLRCSWLRPLIPLKALQFLVPTQLRRQLLIDFRASGPVGDFPQSHVNRARDLLHFLKINLVNRVAGTVVVFVHSVKEENYRNAFARVVEMIATEEEPVGIVGIVIAIIVSNIQILFVHSVGQLTKFAA